MDSWQSVVELAIIAALICFALWHGTPTDAILVLAAGVVNSPFAKKVKPPQETTFNDGTDGK